MGGAGDGQAGEGRALDEPQRLPSQVGGVARALGDQPRGGERGEGRHHHGHHVGRPEPGQRVRPLGVGHELSQVRPGVPGLGTGGVDLDQADVVGRKVAGGHLDGPVGQGERLGRVAARLPGGAGQQQVRHQLRRPIGEGGLAGVEGPEARVEAGGGALGEGELSQGQVAVRDLAVRAGIVVTRQAQGLVEQLACLRALAQRGERVAAQQGGSHQPGVARGHGPPAQLEEALGEALGVGRVAHGRDLGAHEEHVEHGHRRPGAGHGLGPAGGRVGTRHVAALQPRQCLARERAGQARVVGAEGGFAHLGGTGDGIERLVVPALAQAELGDRQPHAVGAAGGWSYTSTSSMH